MMLVWRLASLVLAIGLGAAACSPTSPERSEQIGIVGYHGDGPTVEVPDSARSGETFEVAVETYGNSCYSAGRTELTQDGLAAGITPYDVVATEGPCEDIQLTFVHRVRLQFHDEGVARLIIRGRRLPEDTLVQVAREIVVHKDLE